MENIKLRHKVAFHALTASIVLNLVLAVCLDRIVSGRVTVEPARTASILPW
jgi:hypothetical protein